MKKKKIILGIVIFIILILIASAVGFALSSSIPSKMSEKKSSEASLSFLKTVNYDYENFEKRWMSSTERLNIYSSEFENKIMITYICKNKKDYDKPTVILIHDYGKDQKSMYPIADMFLENDFNVAMYDQRAHGSNTAKNVTYGFYERYDLKEVIDYISSGFTTDSVLGVLGQGVGAATAAYHSATQFGRETLDFMILDGVYDNLEDAMNIRIKNSKLPFPDLISKISSKAVFMNYGYKYSEVSPEDVITASSTPALVLNSTQDDVYPFQMGEDVFKAITHESKELVTFQNSKHGMAFYEEKEKYEKSVFDFINKFVIDK